MAKWEWQAGQIHGLGFHQLKAIECCIDITPRPPYCDRGKWECHVVDEGYPLNHNPVDAADMFPRLFFSLERAKAEMEDWMNERGYSPMEAGDD